MRFEFSFIFDNKQKSVIIEAVDENGAWDKVESNIGCSYFDPLLDVDSFKMEVKK